VRCRVLLRLCYAVSCLASGALLLSWTHVSLFVMDPCLTLCAFAMRAHAHTRTHTNRSHAPWAASYAKGSTSPSFVSNMESLRVSSSGESSHINMESLKLSERRASDTRNRPLYSFGAGLSAALRSDIGGWAGWGGGRYVSDGRGPIISLRGRGGSGRAYRGVGVGVGVGEGGREPLGAALESNAAQRGGGAAGMGMGVGGGVQGVSGSAGLASPSAHAHERFAALRL
jgi:hypothetical protein